MGSNKRDLLSSLLEANVFKIGEFLLKSGKLSPIYIDLRSIISHPNIVKSLAEEIYTREKVEELCIDAVCGVPYTALPIASVYSVLYNVPMIMKRKEAKNYGTKKMVEGMVKPGDKCLIIEDIVTSGSSVIETAEVLRNEGLVVTDCIVVLNRLQGGEENLSKAGIRLHSLFTISDMFNKYCTINTVEENMVLAVKKYLKDNSYISVNFVKRTKCIPFDQRSNTCTQPVARRLLQIIAQKKSNLCLSLDETSSSQLLILADLLGPQICLLKTHIDILNDYSEKTITDLQKLAKKWNFLIMEDRKFADIGNTVMNQYSNGMYKIGNWADIVTVHGLPGKGVLEALRRAFDGKERACVLIAEMSSEGALTDDTYKSRIVDMADNHSDIVIGFVSQSYLSENKNFIQMAPGVNLSCSGDGLGQQYKSPEQAVSNGADILIVGRGIIKAENILDSAHEYKNQGFEAYLKKCEETLNII